MSFQRKDGFWLPIIEIPLEPEEDWQDDTKCRGVDPNVFFPPGDGGRLPKFAPPAVEEPLSLCNGCPVRGSCLLTALYTESDEWSQSGIMGGMTPPERGRFRKILARRGRSIGKFRYSGWTAHTFAKAS